MKINKTWQTINYFMMNWRVVRFYNFFIYVYKAIHFKRFENFNHTFTSSLTWTFHRKKTYKWNAKKHILFQSNHWFEKNKKIHAAKINNTCVRFKSSLNHNAALRSKNSICWNVETSWWLFLSNVLNLLLIKQNWYLKKREIHCFFQSWFDDVWNVISKNCTIHVKTMFMRKPQWCHWNKMTLPSREFDDAAEAKNNSFKKNDDVRWKWDDYIIKFMIYNHQLVSSKIMIKLLNNFKTAFIKCRIFFIIF